ncbi:hypothetical protein GO495_00760 [Chitinophaga oryziterrae]|uniref:Acid-shock protein n=1 Tax=Chitinophaga oryziterrae TaxID=1031224 RepID=A0A6N8J328_9BACT|nr:hypothetical protein [Chitinophaga oryziterrae]MVT39098.1 hypothetical protein [Chitinophaga oryziterrae]
MQNKKWGMLAFTAATMATTTVMAQQPVVAKQAQKKIATDTSKKTAKVALFPVQKTDDLKSPKVRKSAKKQ